MVPQLILALKLLPLSCARAMIYVVAGEPDQRTDPC